MSSSVSHVYEQSVTYSRYSAVEAGGPWFIFWPGHLLNAWALGSSSVWWDHSAHLRVAMVSKWSKACNALSMRSGASNAPEKFFKKIVSIKHGIASLGSFKIVRW
jgi:hypothetical protein